MRLPAAYTGTFGFKPSYGMVSRYGVVAYSNSLDTVGVLARKIADVRNVFGAFSCMLTAGGTHDEQSGYKDMTRRTPPA